MTGPGADEEMRPINWEKVINTASETCYWLEPDGTRHEGTPEENAEVRRQLLEMRTKADKRRQDASIQR